MTTEQETADEERGAEIRRLAMGSDYAFAELETVLRKVEGRVRLSQRESDLWVRWIGGIAATDELFEKLAQNADENVGMFATVFRRLMKEKVLRGGKRIFDSLLKGEFPEYWIGKLKEYGDKEYGHPDCRYLVKAVAMELLDEQVEKPQPQWTCGNCGGTEWSDNPVAGGPECVKCGGEAVLEKPAPEPEPTPEKDPDLFERTCKHCGAAYCVRIQPTDDVMFHAHCPGCGVVEEDLVNPWRQDEVAFPEDAELAERAARSNIVPVAERAENDEPPIDLEDLFEVQCSRCGCDFSIQNIAPEAWPKKGRSTHCPQCNKHITGLMPLTPPELQPQPEPDAIAGATPAELGQRNSQRPPEPKTASAPPPPTATTTTQTGATGEGSLSDDEARAELERRLTTIAAEHGARVERDVPVSAALQQNSKPLQETPVEVSATATGPIWKSSSKGWILISSMDDQHLLNALRIAQSKVSNGEDGLRGSADDLRAEALRRGLKVEAADTRLALSPFRLSMAAKCGYQEHYRYQEGIKTKPRAATLAGSGIHKSAEANLQVKALTEGEQTLPLEDAKMVAAEAVEHRFEEEGISLFGEEKSVSEKEWRGRTVDKAVLGAEVHHTRLAPEIRPIEVEEKLTINIPGEDFYIYGYPDVTEEKRVRDLKTGGKQWGPYEADGELALTIYGLGKRIKDGKAPESYRIDGIYTRTKALKLYHVDTTRDDQDFRNMLVQSKKAAAAIRAGTLMPARWMPGAWWCSEKWCGWFQICPFGARMGKHPASKE